VLDAPTTAALSQEQHLSAVPREAGSRDPPAQVRLDSPQSCHRYQGIADMEWAEAVLGGFFISTNVAKNPWTMQEHKDTKIKLITWFDYF